MSKNTLFAGHATIRARSLCVGARIDLRTLEKTHKLAAAPIVLPAGGTGCAVLFRYGVVALFDLQAVEEASFLAHIRPFIHQPIASPQIEELVVRVEPAAEERLESGVLTLRDLDIVRVQIVADVLAKSVVLAQHETDIAAAFDRIEPLAESLGRTGRVGAGGRELLRQLGGNLLVRHRMVGRVEVSEKSDVLWDRPEHERLYARLAEEYEIRDRHLALERKHDLIAQTAETLLDLLQQRRSLRVEWYIVALIVIEILLTLYAMLARA